MKNSKTDLCVVHVKCPAKINLTLEITGRRPDGFHNIKSVMQTINLYDFLTLEKISEGIELCGNSTEIPYDEKNIVYKAAQKFFDASGIKGGVKIYIEKNIPVCAGLGGGSSDAAGTLVGLNMLFDRTCCAQGISRLSFQESGAPLSRARLHKICSSLGSDLNFCLEGGTKIASGRGENLESYPYQEYDVSLVKPKNLAVSAKEAYSLYALFENKPKSTGFLFNALEFPVIAAHPELKRFKDSGLNMSGSGPTFFCLEKKLPDFDKTECILIEGLKTVETGVEIFLNK